jgi:hypothetical protein
MTGAAAGGEFKNLRAQLPEDMQDPALELLTHETLGPLVAFWGSIYEANETGIQRDRPISITTYSSSAPNGLLQTKEVTEHFAGKAGLPPETTAALVALHGVLGETFRRAQHYIHVEAVDRLPPGLRSAQTQKLLRLDPRIHIVVAHRTLRMSELSSPLNTDATVIAADGVTRVYSGNYMLHHEDLDAVPQLARGREYGGEQARDRANLLVYWAQNALPPKPTKNALARMAIDYNR